MSVIEFQARLKHRQMRDEFVNETQKFQIAVGIAPTGTYALEIRFDDMSLEERERMISIIKSQRLICDLIRGDTYAHDESREEIWLIKVNKGTPFEQWVVGQHTDPGSVRFIRG